MVIGEICRQIWTSNQFEGRKRLDLGYNNSNDGKSINFY